MGTRYEAAGVLWWRVRRELTDRVLGQVDKKPYGVGAGNGSGDANPESGADLSRRPSKRQQEKAPEGRAPRVTSDDEGGEVNMDEVPSGADPASAESRFTEGI